jgi:hypothetical protein
MSEERSPGVHLIEDGEPQSQSGCRKNKFCPVRNHTLVIQLEAFCSTDRAVLMFNTGQRKIVVFIWNYMFRYENERYHFTA